MSRLELREVLNSTLDLVFVLASNLKKPQSEIEIKLVVTYDQCRRQLSSVDKNNGEEGEKTSFSG